MWLINTGNNIFASGSPGEVYYFSNQKEHLNEDVINSAQEIMFAKRDLWGIIGCEHNTNCFGQQLSTPYQVSNSFGQKKKDGPRDDWANGSLAVMAAVTAQFLIRVHKRALWDVIDRL